MAERKRSVQRGPKKDGETPQLPGSRLPKEQCVGQTCYRLVHGTDEPPSFCPHSELLHDGQEHTVERHVERLAGDFLVTVSPLRDSTGRLIGSVHLARDVTERKRTEGDLRRTTALLDSVRAAQELYLTQGEPEPVFESLLQTLVCMTDSEYGFLDEVLTDDQGKRYKLSLAISDISWDDASRALYAQLRARNLEFRDLNNLAGLPAAQDSLVIANDVPHDAHSRGVSPGHPPLRSFMGIPLHFGGELVGVAGVANRPGGYDEAMARWLEPFLSTTASIIHSVRLRNKERAISEALRESEARLRQAATAGNVGLWDWDLRTNRVYFSPEWKRQIGYLDHEISDDSTEWQDRVHPDDLDRCLRIVRAFIEKPWPNYRLEFRFRHKDGSYRWILAQASLDLDEQGKPIRMLGSHIDITQRKRAEEAQREGERRYAEAEKLAAAGRMAAQVAHEINNPLAGIKNSFRLIRDAVPADHPDHDMVGRIEREIDRITHVVRQMYKLHSPRAQTPTDIPVEETICDVLVMLEPLRREHEVAIELASVLPQLIIKAPEGSLQQVLYNLTANAIQASPRGGVVGIAAEPTDQDHVRISIRDQGPMIPAEVQDRMFEPFFTAETGGGTKTGIGLGLSIVKSIVESLKGRIESESRVGEGTCFHVYLPAKQPETQRA